MANNIIIVAYNIAIMILGSKYTIANAYEQVHQNGSLKNNAILCVWFKHYVSKTLYNAYRVASS